MNFDWYFIKVNSKIKVKDQIKNIPALAPIMARRRPGNKPLSEPMMIILPRHMGVTRPQCVKWVEIKGAATCDKFYKGI